MKTPKLNLPFKKNPVLAKLFAFIAVVAVFGAGVYAGIAYDQRRHGLDMSKFWQVYDLVQSNYVGSVDKNKVVEGAISGMVSGLGDQFSSYLNTTDKQNLSSELSGQFQGIGAELVEKNGVITVVSPLSGTPAEKAGIKPNDIIAKIDGTSTDGMTVNDAVNKIRGPKGTTVTLTVLHSGDTKTVDIKVTRDDIQVKSVTSKMLPNNVAYVQIEEFGETTPSEMASAISDIVKQSPKAIVIDLRNNPGGYLSDVPPMAGMFIAPSVVVKEQYKDGKMDELQSTGLPVLPNTPMYILINGGSASAAEIFAGAMQDYKRATIIGEQSFGKGSVQNLIDLPGDSALRITIAEWLTPNGRTISKVGITPDVVVKDTKTDTSDPVLDKALELANK